MFDTSIKIKHKEKQKKYRPNNVIIILFCYFDIGATDMQYRRFSETIKMQ